MPNEKPENIDQLLAFYKAYYKPLFLSTTAVKLMFGAELVELSNKILPFLNTIQEINPYHAYVERVKGLEQLQQAFENTGSFKNQKISDIQYISHQQYLISLLLSIISTSHRFEIMQLLKNFMHYRIKKSENILVLGFGSGFELWLMKNINPNCKIEAYDANVEAYQFAKQYLQFMRTDDCCLSQKWFAINVSSQCEARYDRIILCEILEHLENPRQLLTDMHKSLNPDGLIFATMAINIAQEDHIYLCRNANEARQIIDNTLFDVVFEQYCPMTIFPFHETQRNTISNKGNFVWFLKSRK